jgi:hypothetical protein
MDERDAVGRLIERIISAARVPGDAERDDLRRELWTHFEEAGTSPETLRESMRRFGAESLVTESFRRVYRFEYALLYLAKVAASVAASAAAALLIEVFVNLRVEVQAEVLRLAPGFSRAAGGAVAVVLALVTAWEVVKPPFSRPRAAAAIAAFAAVSVAAQLLFAVGIGAFVTATMLVVLGCACAKIPRILERLVLLVVGFAAVLYGSHLLQGVAFGMGRALLAGSVLSAVWCSASAIVVRVDNAFGGFFATASRPPL